MCERSGSAETGVHEILVGFRGVKHAGCCVAAGLAAGGPARRIVENPFAFLDDGVAGGGIASPGEFRGDPARVFGIA